MDAYVVPSVEISSKRSKICIRRKRVDSIASSSKRRDWPTPHQVCCFGYGVIVILVVSTIPYSTIYVLASLQ